jgi:uracil-DNA glycosylase
MAKVHMPADWKKALAEEFSQPYFDEIVGFLKQEKQAGKIIYPTGPNIFHAFEAAPLHTVKVVILGQDPYHGAGQAHGLSFSVQLGVRAPPSLVNVFKEIHDDLGLPIPHHGNLERWAKQGVLLLNAALTVEAHKANSHAKIGWHRFTDAVIKAVSDERPHVVFMLWGKFAQSKAELIDQSKHLILMSAHPSPYSAEHGFFGSRPFSKANAWLKKHDMAPIDWSLPE